MKIFSEMIKDVIEKIFNAFARRQIKLGEIMSQILMFKRP